MPITGPVSLDGKWTDIHYTEQHMGLGNVSWHILFQLVTVALLLAVLWSSRCLCVTSEMSQCWRRLACLAWMVLQPMHRLAVFMFSRQLAVGLASLHYEKVEVYAIR